MGYKMISKVMMPVAATLLSGCGYHFATQVDAYDLMPRPFDNKRIEIIAPDESIESRIFTLRLANGLSQKGFVVASSRPDYVLKYRYSRPLENMQYSTQPVTGVVGYVVEKKTRHSDKRGHSETEYDYKPVEGVIGTETYSQMYFWRHLEISVYPGHQSTNEVLRVSMKSNAPVTSDNAAYTAMIDALTEKFDSPLRSGNYVALIPW